MKVHLSVYGDLMVEKHAYSSVQVECEGDLRDQLLRFARWRIADRDLAADGRETNPHITVKYGLHTTNSEEVREILAREAPIHAVLGRTTYFANVEEGTADAVVLEIESDCLHRVNAALSNGLAHTSTYPTYVPHLTVAYVQPGQGQKYAGDTTFLGQRVSFGYARFSSKDGAQAVLPLRGIAKGGPGSGNYGHMGRPGEVGGSGPGNAPPGGAPARVPPAIMDAIHHADGGFTYHAVTGDQPTTGYALSLHKDRERVISRAASVTVEDLAQYTLDNYDLLVQDNNYIGGWHNPNDGKAYLDVSTVVETSQDAERLGREHQQLAYFDLQNGRSVEIHEKASTQSHRTQKGATNAGRFDRARAPVVWTRADTRRDRARKSDARQSPPESLFLTLFGFLRKGGAGSGNFGHAGRPGEVGGSGPGGGGDRAAEPHAAWQSSGGWEHTGISWKQDTDPVTGRPIPIKAVSIDHAVALILEGRVVEVPDVAGAHTLITKLAAYATQAKADGRNARDYDLCNVAVAGSSLFCGQSVRTKEHPQGIPRLYMPQLGGTPIPGSEADSLPRTRNSNEVDGADYFIKHLQGIGMRTTKEVVPAASLKASQRELKGQHVASMMLDTTFDPAKNPVFVSSDDYVVDGHHRWAAVVGRDLEDGHLGDSTMNIVRVNAPISEVLHIATAWSTKFGIQQAAGVTQQGAATGLLQKGGPGSGNYGHAGRPGEVGGSAPGDGGESGPGAGRGGVSTITQQRLGLPGEAPRVTTREFVERLHGYHAVEINNLPREAITNFGIMVEGTADLPESAAEGVALGLNDLAHVSPGLHELIQKDVLFAAVTYKDDPNPDHASAAVTLAAPHDPPLVLVNGRPSGDWREFERSTEPMPTIPLQIARDKELKGDDFVREAYRGTIIHEAGHLADIGSRGAISTSVSMEVTLHALGDDERAFNLVRDKLSPYAASGPEEAAAELFTAVVYQRPIAPEFRRSAGLVRTLLQRPYGPPKEDEDEP